MISFVTDMNLSEIAAAHMIEAIQTKELPLCVQHLLQKGGHSETMSKLARLDESASQEEIFFLFQAILEEKNISMENQKVAAFILVNYFIKEIVTGAMDPVTGVEHLLNQVYSKVNRLYHDVKFFGDSLHLEKLFGLYYAMEDLDSDQQQEEMEKTREEIDDAIEKELLVLAREYNSKYLYALEDRA